ncbi:MAG: tyrosine-type recombinase/integrase [Algoriphagus aquaeductus]|uniref:tyrosine-type recombinase/integrase n=1 Tax=Algoriphagus aquaeductus TaxID=475299 RepID=UPI003879D248
MAGKSQSTVTNYGRHLAKLALHFNHLPTEVDPDRVNDYLHLVKRGHNTPSDSYFKFTVYALRFAYRIEGMKDKRIELPTIKHSKKLPVVLSQEDVRRLLKAPNLLKHRVLIGLLYGCGLRCFEVRNLKIADLDFDQGGALRKCPVDIFSEEPACRGGSCEGWQRQKRPLRPLGGYPDPGAESLSGG